MQYSGSSVCVRKGVNAGLIPAGRFVPSSGFSSGATLYFGFFFSILVLLEQGARTTMFSDALQFLFYRLIIEVQMETRKINCDFGLVFCLRAKY